MSKGRSHVLDVAMLQVGFHRANDELKRMLAPRLIRLGEAFDNTYFIRKRTRGEKIK